MSNHVSVLSHSASRKKIIVKSSLFIVLMLVFSLVGTALAVAGDLHWHDQYDLAEKSDFVMAMTSDNELLYVAGIGINENDLSEWTVRAYNNDDGSLVWEDIYFGGTTSPSPRAISIEDGRLFVGGDQNIAYGDWILRAYDASNGDLIWQEYLEDGRVKAIVADSRKVIAAGNGRDEAGNFVNLVRAYDARNGNLLWQKEYESGSLDFVELTGTTIILAGSYSGGVGNSNWIIRALDIRNGVERWVEQFDLAGGHDQINSIALNKENVYVAGYGLNEVGNFDWLVRAYNALDGSLQWQNQFDLAGDFDIANDIAVSGNRVLVAGVSGLNVDSFDGDGIIRTYSGQDGTILWDEQLDVNETDNGFDLIAVKGQQIIVAGTDYSLNGYFGWNVTSYNSTTGNLLWQDDLVNNGIFDEAVAIASGNEMVFVAGEVTQNGEWTDWLINAYSLR
ncbi:MAG: hypothetical protein DHS20C20_08520 [Ardenticatenaceae bacterium]|nr:MAG: hypothetical protein DHS20C20_08520 [Ardenticatenaceae bacterium]